MIRGDRMDGGRGMGEMTTSYNVEQLFSMSNTMRLVV